MDAQGGPREYKGWGTNCLASEENLERREYRHVRTNYSRELLVLLPVFNAASVSGYHQAKGMIVQ